MSAGTTTKGQATAPILPVATFVGPPISAIAYRVGQAHALILKVTSDLSDDQLTGRPAPVPPAVAPCIGWHLWHLSRWADLVQASIPGMTPELERRLGRASQIWEAEDLAARWGLSTDALGYRQAGTGLDDNESATLPLPGKDVLLDYARKALGAVDRAVAAVDDQQFQTRCIDLYGNETSVGTAVMSHLSHANRHLGMIEALRGVLGVRGTATR